MKVSILTPTYNDGKSIEETLNSIKNQTFGDWESIIIDDGSTDNTKEIIKEYAQKNGLQSRIKYIYQKNSDQLNALINGMSKISGDYVFILHSDDLFPTDDFLSQAVSKIKELDCDAIIGDLVIINENSETTNRWKALKYRRKKFIPVLLMLNNGCNIFGDFSLQKKEVFANQVKENYLKWNTPFWLDFNNSNKMLNIKNVKFPILKYRIHSENYANNEIGKFNALNGEIRTLTKLMNDYDIPMYNLQKGILKLIRMKGIRRLKLTTYFRPIYFNRPAKNKYKILRQMIKNTYKNYDENEYLNSVLEFYRNYCDRSIEIEDIKKEDIYQGSDIRIFTKKLYNNSLPLIYYIVMQEMRNGFNNIIVSNNEQRELAINLTKFLNIYPYVKTSIKGEK